MTNKRYALWAILATAAGFGTVSCDEVNRAVPWECNEYTCPSGVCVDGACVAAGDCGGETCTGTQTCVDNKCVEKSDLCGSEVCKATETCIDSKCVENTSLCGGKLCTSLQTCLESECVLTATLCGGKKCSSGTACYEDRCESADRVCKNGAVLCDDGSQCFNDECTETAAICGGITVCELGTEECVDGTHCEEIDLCRNKVCSVEGQKCDAEIGECRDRRPCEDIACPDGKACAVTAAAPMGECIESACAVVVEGNDVLGEMSCDEGQMCVGGSCVDDGCIIDDKPRDCGNGWECIKGDCYETACLGVTCDAGRSCSGGECYDDECLPLDEHVCESGTTCSVGECVLNACIGVTCKQNKICIEDGSCVFSSAPELVAVPSENMETTEAGGTSSIGVTLSQEPASVVTMECEVITEAVTPEAEVSCGSISFNGSNYKEVQYVSIVGLADNTVDADQTYSVKLTTHSEEEEFEGLIVKVDGFVNKNVDVATVSFVDESGAVLADMPALMTYEEGETTARVWLVLGTKPSAAVTIEAVSANTAEGVIIEPDGGKVVIDPEDWKTPVAITVKGVEDNGVADGPQTYNITFNVISDDVNYNNIAISPVSVTNVDNDSASWGYDETKVLIVDDSGSSTDTFSISLGSTPKSDVKVALSLEGEGAEKVSLEGASELLFTADNYTAQYVVVKGLSDDVVDADKDFKLKLVSSSSDVDYDGKVIEVGGVVKNTNVGGLTSTPLTSTDIHETGSATATFRLNAKPSADVKVAVSSSDTTELVVSPAEIVVKPENWNVAQVVTLSGVQDDIIDGDQLADVLLKLESEDANFVDEAAVAWSVKVLDDNKAVLKAVNTKATLNENAESDTISVTLSAKPEKDVKIALSLSNSSYASLDKTELLFTAENWNVAQSVVLTATDNKSADSNHNVTLSLKASSEDEHFQWTDSTPDLARSFVYTIIDDEQVKVVLTLDKESISSGEEATATVSISSLPVSDITISVSSTVSSVIMTPSTLSFTSTSELSQNVKLTVDSSKSVTLYETAKITASAAGGGSYDGQKSEAKTLEIVSFVPMTDGTSVAKIDSSVNQVVTVCDNELELVPGYYKLEVWGAAGGDAVNNDQTKSSHGGLGGYSSGYLRLTDKMKVYLHYGTIGTAVLKDQYASTATGGGCNGGANGASDVSIGYGGGGASDIRIAVDDVYHRVIVAGGGGGADNYYTANETINGGDDGSGGYAGGLTGGNGKTNGGTGVAGATQTSGYAFGAGENVSTHRDLGGGGGGWFGGYAASGQYNAGGSGGSGFVYTEETQATVDTVIANGISYALDSRYYLLGSELKGGNETFAGPDGTAETGHKNNGVVRITPVKVIPE